MLKHATIISLACVLAFGGCMSPGEIDNDTLNRYQQAMLARSPQHRTGQTGSDLLKATAGTTGPQLKVIRDEKNPDAIPQVELTLNEAIMRALANSMDIRIASFAPAIDRESMINAAAAFDYIFFFDYSFTRTDKRIASTFGGDQAKLHSYKAGIKQTNILGGTASAAWAMTRTWDNSSFQSLPNRYEPTFIMEVTQPLLRDAWPEVNLATLRIARINRQVSISQFRQTVEQLVSDVVDAYWTLAQARQQLVIQQKLLDDTIKTLKRTEDRRGIDATDVEVSQVKASVAAREAALFRAKKNIGDTQDRLARLLADSQLNLLEHYDIVPASELKETPVQLDPVDQLVTALQNNPRLEQAKFAIATADINVRVAKQQTLPKLDLTASATYQGLDRHMHEAHEKLGTMDYLSYAIALSFEYPIGNRQRQADYRKAKLQRLKTIAQLQDTADQVAVDVNERVRQVQTSYQEILAQRTAVAAAANQLKALENLEETRGRLTPEFLRVKLSAQSQLAETELAELYAVVAYKTALVDLHRATGTILKMTDPNIKILIPEIGEGKFPTNN